MLEFFSLTFFLVGYNSSMKKLVLIATFITLITQSNSHAKFKGEINFTPAEIADHFLKSSEQAQLAKDCLEDYKQQHLNFYYSHCRRTSSGTICLSKYYGDQRYSKRRNQRTANGKPLAYLPDELSRYGFDRSLVNQMENMSCVGLALKCLSRSFHQTNQAAVWKRILAYTKLNNVDGSALQEALRGLGWKVYYWNPAQKNDLLRRARIWDMEEQNWQSKGYHAYRWIIMNRKGTYWNNTVDDYQTLLGFEFGTPSFLYQVPFWVGTAHTGFHVFPGTYERVVEAHSLRSILDPTILEFNFFAPMNQATGGGPRWFTQGKYRSGLIAVPPSAF